MRLENPAAATNEAKLAVLKRIVTLDFLPKRVKPSRLEEFRERFHFCLRGRAGSKLLPEMGAIDR